MTSWLQERFPAFVALSLFAGTAGAAQSVNLYLAEMQEIKNRCLPERTAHEETRRNAMGALLAEGKTRYETMLEREKQTGNITGMAVARTGITVFEGFSEQFQKRGDFAFPATVRRELEEHIAQLKTRKTELDAACKTAIDALDEKYLPLFKECVKAQGADLPDAEVKKLFLDLMGTRAPAVSSPATGETPIATASSSNEPPPVIVSSGSSSNWVPFARWFASVGSLEVLQVGVANVRESSSFRGTSMMGGTYEVRYEAIREISPSDGALFRALPLDGKRAPDVVEWPTARNKWTFSLRVRPVTRGSLRQGLELQVSYPGAETVPVIGDVVAVKQAQAAAAAVKKVKVRFVTQPPAAFVYVDGKREETNGVPALTPCVVSLVEGGHQVKLRKAGYLDATVANLAPEDGREFTHVFQKDPRFVERKVQVPARGKWRDAGLSVGPGDMVLIEVIGQWSCGNKGELVGPEGYSPSDAQFFHYYQKEELSPRSYPKINYGALIMKVGAATNVVAVTRDFKATIRTSGALQFDINESEYARNDNTSALSLAIRKGPAGEP